MKQRAFSFLSYPLVALLIVGPVGIERAWGDESPQCVTAVDPLPCDPTSATSFGNAGQAANKGAVEATTNQAGANYSAGSSAAGGNAAAEQTTNAAQSAAPQTTALAFQAANVGSAKNTACIGSANGVNTTMTSASTQIHSSETACAARETALAKQATAAKLPLVAAQHQEKAALAKPFMAATDAAFKKCGAEMTKLAKQCGADASAMAGVAKGMDMGTMAGLAMLGAAAGGLAAAMKGSGDSSSGSTKDDTANCDYTTHELVVENGKSTCVAKCGTGLTRNYSTGSCDKSTDSLTCLAGTNSDGTCKDSGLGGTTATTTNAGCPVGTTSNGSVCVTNSGATTTSAGTTGSGLTASTTGGAGTSNALPGDPSSSSLGSTDSSAGTTASTGTGTGTGSGSSGSGAGGRTASTTGGSGAGGANGSGGGGFGGFGGFGGSGGGAGSGSEGGVAGSITSDNLVPDDEVFTGANGQKYVRRFVNGQWGNYVIFNQSKPVRDSVRANALNDAFAPRKPASASPTRR